jgi:hypothetical protein
MSRPRAQPSQAPRSRSKSHQFAGGCVTLARRHLEELAEIGKAAGTPCSRARIESVNHGGARSVTWAIWPEKDEVFAAEITSGDGLPVQRAT